MRPAVLLPALLLVASLAGCADDAGGPSSRAGFQEEPLSAGGEAIPEPVPLSGASPDPHGDVQREESAVETDQGQDGMWTARMTVSLANGVGDVNAAAVALDTSSGSIDATGIPAGSYAIVAIVEARGPTEQIARDELARHTVMHTDSMEDGRLVLATWLESEPFAEVPPVPPVTEGFDLGLTTASMSLSALLPEHLSYDLDAEASSGSVRASALRGDSMSFSTSSGSIGLQDLAACEVSADASSGGIDATGIAACEISAEASSGAVSVSESRAAKLEASTSSGSIDVEGAFDSASLEASSGSVSARLAPEASGSYSLAASSGSISLELATGGGRAYDATGSTSSGQVHIELQDGEVVEEDEDGSFAHVRTRAFDSANIQTTVEAEASSGSVNIQG